MKKILASIYDNLKLVFRLIPSELRAGYIKVGVLSIVLAVIEFVGVSILIPFFNEVTDSPGYTYLKIYNQLTHQNISLEKASSIILSLGIVIGLLLIKALLSNYVIFRQYRFGSIVQARVSENLFSLYFKRPYAEIINGNSSELIRNLVQETNKLNENIIVPSFLLITDTMLIGSIGLFLLIFQPLPTVILFLVLALLYGTSAFFLGKNLTAWGKLRFSSEGLRVKLVQEGIGLFTEIKLKNLLKDYLKKYRKANEDNARYTYLLNANLQVPRHLLEVFIFTSLLVMIIIYSSIGAYSNKDFIKMLGIFAIAAYRLLPTLNRLTNGIQVIRFYKPSIGVFTEKINIESHDDTRNDFTFKNEIQVHNLQLSYGNLEILKNINFSIMKGETVGVIGKSGSGKTSLAHCILGLTKPTNGHIRVDDIDVQNNVNGWRNIVGYVPQNVFLLDDTIQNNIAYNFTNSEVNSEKLNLAATQAGLKEWIDNLPEKFNTIVGERGGQVSGGQIQRIGIARALYHDPEVIVFDESTSALDSNTEKQFLETIESLKKDKTVLFITHKKAPLSICTRVLIIENGTIKTEINKSN